MSEIRTRMDGARIAWVNNSVRVIRADLAGWHERLARQAGNLVGKNNAQAEACLTLADMYWEALKCFVEVKDEGGIF